MMNPEPHAMHRWLQQLVGDWTSTSGCESAPDQPDGSSLGAEHVRALGELWVILEGTGTLPGGGEAAARCHIARTVVRRAERETVALSRVESVRPQAVRYLNRLSDLLFVLSRVLARASGHGEVLWNHERRRG